MARVTAGLKKMIEDGRIPAARYGGEITSIQVRKGWEIARVKIVESEDEELLGRQVSFFLLNEDQGNSIGLQQLMTHLHWEDVPEDEEGEQDTKTSLIGVKFKFDLFYEGSQQRVRPVLEEEDYAWQRELMGGGESDEEEEEEEEKPRRKAPAKKKLSKR